MRALASCGLAEPIGRRSRICSTSSRIFARAATASPIASIGFWVGENRTKALTARGLKLWYEAELERRDAAKTAIR